MYVRVCEYVLTRSVNMLRACVLICIWVCANVYICVGWNVVCVWESVWSRVCTYGWSENITCACLNMYMRACEYMFEVCNGHVMHMCVNMCMRSCDESVQIHTYVCSVQICVQEISCVFVKYMRVCEYVHQCRVGMLRCMSVCASQFMCICECANV